MASSGRKGGLCSPVQFKFEIRIYLNREFKFELLDKFFDFGFERVFVGMTEVFGDDFAAWSEQ